MRISVLLISKMKETGASALDITITEIFILSNEASIPVPRGACGKPGYLGLLGSLFRSAVFLILSITLRNEQIRIVIFSLSLFVRFVGFVGFAVRRATQSRWNGLLVSLTTKAQLRQMLHNGTLGEIGAHHIGDLLPGDLDTFFVARSLHGQQE
jgi:hypothetical protein